MLRKKLKRWLASMQAIKNTKSLQIFGQHIHDPRLWHIHREPIARATAIGLLICFLPIPFQMAIAAALAIVFYANLPLSVALVWISNPITIPPILYLAYKVGAYLMQYPKLDYHGQLSWHWFVSQLNLIWYPMLIGCLIFGFFAAIIGYYGMHLLWRLWVIYRWRKR